MQSITYDVDEDTACMESSHANCDGLKICVIVVGYLNQLLHRDANLQRRLYYQGHVAS